MAKTFRVNSDPRVISGEQNYVDRKRAVVLFTQEEIEERSSDKFLTKLQALCEDYGVASMMFMAIRYMEVDGRPATNFTGNNAGLNAVQERFFHDVKKTFRDMEEYALIQTGVNLGFIGVDGRILDRDRLLQFLRGEGEFVQKR